MSLQYFDIEPKNYLTRYNIHQLLCKASDSFSLDETKKNGNNLFYFDKNKNKIIIQSTIPLDFKSCESAFNVRMTKTINPNIKNGDVFKLFSQVNPTKHITVEKRKKVGIWKTDELNAWILRKADIHGFIVNSCSFENNGLIDSGRPTKSLYQNVNVNAVITVNDVDKFQHALNYGIGSAKHLGFGMLLLRRV